MNFQLHPTLEKDCMTVGNFALCRLLMMNDSRFPWFILVPQLSGIKEIYQLNRQQRHQLTDESCYLAEQLAHLYQADKMNIAAIGNIVPQLHVHHIVRHQTDSAWPAPVWGKFDPTPYTADAIGAQLTRLRAQLKLNAR